MTRSPSILLSIVVLALAACGGGSQPSPADQPAIPPADTAPRGAAVAGDVLGTAIHTQDAEELRYVVLQKLTDRYAAEDKAARQEIAAAFIRQWKINRALYQQYGGRIIFQQGGPEPLDAYRTFLEESAARSRRRHSPNRHGSPTTSWGAGDVRGSAGSTTPMPADALTSGPV